MTKDHLQAVVIGAGWAGEGHTRALQYAGVDVHTICARQMDIVRNVADRLGVPHASVDWRRTLEETKPNIVAIATPASLRAEPIVMAADLGCHLFCDKPLDIDTPKAKVLLDAVESAGVKHACAATDCYHPGVAWLASSRFPHLWRCRHPRGGRYEQLGEHPAVDRPGSRSHTPGNTAAAH